MTSKRHTGWRVKSADCGTYKLFPGECLVFVSRHIRDIINFRSLVVFTRSQVINSPEARPWFLHARSRPSEEYRAGFVDLLSREGDRGPCRARRCQDGVLLRCNRADGETPEMVADSRRRRKQSWDLTRRDCRTSGLVFHQADNFLKP